MILLIGATGKTGSETARLVANRGIDVRALVRNRERASEVERSGVEVMQGDAGTAEDLDRALEGAEALFLATTAEPGLPELHTMIVGRAKNAGIRRIVKISAAGADAGSDFRFAAVHGRSDDVIRESGVAYTILRPGFFMQNLLMAAPVIVQQRAFIQPTGTGRTAYIDARDIAAVAAHVLLTSGHDRKVYDLTGPEAFAGEEVARMLSEVLGEPIRFLSPEPAQFAQMLKQVGLPEWLAGGLLEAYETISKGHAARVTNTVQELTGRAPARLERFLRDHRAEFGH
jgi:uncharacterized protein YbjT (DUF2867 family)